MLVREYATDKGKTPQDVITTLVRAGFDLKTHANKLTDEEYRLQAAEVATITRTVWREVETKFLPKRKKY